MLVMSDLSLILDFRAKGVSFLQFLLFRGVAHLGKGVVGTRPEI